jgi:hypothetical protein
MSILEDIEPAIESLGFKNFLEGNTVKQWDHVLDNHLFTLTFSKGWENLRIKGVYPAEIPRMGFETLIGKLELERHISNKSIKKEIHVQMLILIDNIKAKREKEEKANV